MNTALRNSVPSLKRARAEISKDAAKRNFLKLKEKAKSRLICAVVKADAYGHGAIPLARLYSECGCDFFAVSNIDEALALRLGGISEPVLVLGYVPPECAASAAENNITLTVYSRAFAEALSRATLACGVTVNAHLKFDTGMGRIGFFTENTGENSLFDALISSKLQGIKITGAFTHFAVADGGCDEGALLFTELQARRFLTACEYLKAHAVMLTTVHASNSAGVLSYPEHALDMVRLGISLYGLSPSPSLGGALSLEPVMSLKSIISQIKTVNVGDSVGYGRAFVAKRKTRVATVPIGYADGIFRNAGQCGCFVTVKGRAARILGRACMDQLMIDVSAIDGIEPFSETVIFGGGAYESADSFAEKCGTVGYELLTSVSSRVPRVYI